MECSPHPRLAALEGRPETRPFRPRTELPSPFAEDFLPVRHNRYRSNSVRTAPQLCNRLLTLLRRIFCRQVICCEYFRAVSPSQTTEKRHLRPKDREGKGGTNAAWNQGRAGSCPHPNWLVFTRREEKSTVPNPRAWAMVRYGRCSGSRSQ